jgi:serine/threonine-protein kinase
MGTPYYMAPEQAKGARDLDHRVDIYATGVIFYEALTGQVPFNADTFNELLFKIVLEEPRPLEQLVPDIDMGFAAIVNKAMVRDPANRFANCQDFMQALAQWAAGYGPQLAAALGTSQPAGQTGAHMVSPGAVPGVPSPAMGVPGVGTPGAWSQTSGGYGQTGTHEVPKKSIAGLVAGFAVVGVLAVGGGGYAVMHMSKSEDAAAAAQKQAEAAEQERNSAAAKAQAEIEKANSDKAKAEADRQQLQSDKAKVEAENSALSKAAAAAAAEASAAAAKPRAVAVAGKPAAKAAPAPAPAPAPAAAKTSTSNSTTTSSGRKIRTSL